MPSTDQESRPVGLSGEARGKPRIYLDPTFNLSGIIATVVAVASAVSAWVSVQRQLAVQEQRIESLKEVVLYSNNATREAVARLEKAMEQMQARVYDQPTGRNR